MLKFESLVLDEKGPVSPPSTKPQEIIVRQKTPPREKVLVGTARQVSEATEETSEIASSAWESSSSEEYESEDEEPEPDQKESFTKFVKDLKAVRPRRICILYCILYCILRCRLFWYTMLSG